MSIRDRYITREIFKHFGIILIAVVSIFVVVDFFEKIDDFIDAGIPISKILLFFMYRIPFVVSLIAPVGILLAILIVFGLMNKNNELIALRSGGVSATYLLRTVIVIAVMFSIFMFLLADRIVPATITKANRIWFEEVKKSPAIASRQKNIWIKGNRSIAHIKYYQLAKKTISGITLYYFDENFRLKRRIDAKSGEYRDGQWVFNDIMEQTQNPAMDDNDYDIKFFARRVEPFEYKPEELKRVAKKSQEMNFMELLTYIRNVEAEGYDATNYRVDLHAKLAFPVVCLVLSFVAAGYGIKRRGRSGAQGLSVSIGFGLGVTFLYWVFYSFCLSLGYGGVLPPIVAAWMANFIFFGYGVVVFMNVEY
jgi:lipopolysaccharide export system permease protein